MSRSYDFLISALRSLPEKPPDDAARSAKKAYSERMSSVVASAFAEELRQRGLIGTRPSSPGDEAGISGAERRMSGGIGAKKVDVTWSTEQSGLQLAFSVKCINFKDRRGRNYQKNVVNRRGDMLFESVTLHRRFPYAVLGGFMLLDRGAAEDSSNRRNSTFVNTHKRLRLFTGRTDPSGRDEQYERLYVALIEATPFAAEAQLFRAGDSEHEVQLDDALDELLTLVAERNPDFYEFVEASSDAYNPDPGSMLSAFERRSIVGTRRSLISSACAASSRNAKVAHRARVFGPRDIGRAADATRLPDLHGCSAAQRVRHRNGRSARPIQPRSAFARWSKEGTCFGAPRRDERRRGPHRPERQSGRDVDRRPKNKEVARNWRPPMRDSTARIRIAFPTGAAEPSPRLHGP